MVTSITLPSINSLYEVALVALILKLTFPLPSPAGFCASAPTIVAVTERLEGVGITGSSEPLPEPLQERKTNKNKPKTKPIFALKVCIFIISSLF